MNLKRYVLGRHNDKYASFHGMHYVNQNGLRFTPDLSEARKFEDIPSALRFIQMKWSRDNDPLTLFVLEQTVTETIRPLV